MNSRRDFLKAAGAVSISAAAPQAAQPAERQKLPQVQLGCYSISRLICGANVFNGGSHLSVFVNYEMKKYYTPEQILKTLRRCEEVGINCWQAGKGNLENYRHYVDSGGKMHFLALEHSEPEVVKTLARGGCIGIAHHGEVTDRLFKQGKIDQIQDYLKMVRDSGMLVGISTHMPAVVDTVESKGWDFDYYMTCVYERHRTKEELEKLLGQAPIPVGEVYLPNDPPRMYRMVQQTKKPCLAFKILAAGRLSEHPQWIEQAFRNAFNGIKKTDAVIVGMWDRYSDQPGENAEFVRRFGAA
ncbi:MAG TPA: twin-arginine translocation signal domain-containing protein [Bryobacteraceae bacterium]|nr:twin-arginine translocation signal domain-containing protein [Bryobacteraceae bacterium]